LLGERAEPPMPGTPTGRPPHFPHHPYGFVTVQESLKTTGLLEAPLPPPPPAARTGAVATLLGRVGRTIPPVLVFAALGGLLVWGHHSGWTVPKFSALAGGAPDGKDDWCGEHSVPESQCVECNPGLMPRPKDYGWCKRHGVHECPLEHPEVAQTQTRPQVSATDLERAQRALDFAERPENNRRCKSYQRRIQFTSQGAVEKAGIEVDPVREAPVVEFVTGNGEIRYDQTLTARLSARVPGTVFRATKMVGDTVEKGEVLALVDAAEVGKAKAEFLQALVQVRSRGKNYERMQAAAGSIPERSIREMETLLSEARIRLRAAQQALTNLGLPVHPNSLQRVGDDQLSERLRFLGLPGEITRTLEPETTSNLLPVTAPLEGVVVARETVAGEVIDNHKVLFVVVDTRQVWLTLDLRLEDAKSVRLGQKVRFRPDGSQEETVGSITWVSTEADRKTRTVKVRAVLANAEGRLRANTFGAGKVILREESKAVVVKNEAVHWEGDCHVVFVRDKDYLKAGAPKVFHVRTVRPGARDDKQTEIIAGVLPGEAVATKGSAALRAELLRANLGEG
jgi:cobalt-zinc-cadmium efflux system membrane fusion protein